MWCVRACVRACVWKRGVLCSGGALRLVNALAPGPWRSDFEPLGSQGSLLPGRLACSGVPVSSRRQGAPSSRSALPRWLSWPAGPSDHEHMKQLAVGRESGAPPLPDRLGLRASPWRQVPGRSAGQQAGRWARA